MKDNLKKFPGKAHAFPGTLLIGDFSLEVDEITHAGAWDLAKKEFHGASGTAWLKFDCDGSAIVSLDPGILTGLPRLQHTLEVVHRVTNPQTQISYMDALRVQPDAQVGQNLTLYLGAKPADLQEMIQLNENILDWLKTAIPKGQVLVEFQNATVQLEPSLPATGRIVEGSAVYPTHPAIPKVIQLQIEGFTVFISSLKLTPHGASGQVSVQLPGGIATVDTCQPASLDLGEVRITPDCEFYIEAPDTAFGPWLLGDTGLEIEGKGYVLDLSTTNSPPGWPAAWQGLLLMNGQGSGKNYVPDPCNSGYLQGLYGFTNAIVTQDGFDGLLSLQKSCQFHALNPSGYTFRVESGWLLVSSSQVLNGELGPGTIELPRRAVCKGAPGAQVVVKFNLLSVQPDLDLDGEVDYGGNRLSWGELIHSGAEVIAWTAPARQGLVYLPAGPLPSFCPESGGSFITPSLSTAVDASLPELETYQMAGVTFIQSDEAVVFSPDRPGGTSNPIKLVRAYGWLRVGSQGLDGQLMTYNQLNNEKLGEPARPGYAGVIPFVANLFDNDKRNLVAQFVTSAVYDSNFSGRFKIPDPCAIPALNFKHMQITSTGHLVGGDIALPSGGVPLDYWQLQLVPTGAPDQAGIVSVRTGRIIFIAAGISEPRHFATPFVLTWGEMLADGNLGQLYFNLNSYGQRFDGIPYNPQQIMLSKYVPGTVDPYLATCGSIHFNFFGPGYVNIRDARDATSAAPYNNRRVTVPKTGEGAGCKATNLHLEGTWKDIISNDLATIDCPDADVNYHDSIQDGFIGTGTSEIAFFHSDGLDTEVEIHHDATDVRLSSTTSHDIDMGLFSRLGAIGQIGGCARIEGPLMTRMSFYGILEESIATGMSILAPKAGFAVEIEINVTPNSLDFYASGDMMMSVSAVDVELSASVHLLFDYEQAIAEGELIGRIDCDAVLAGLSGEGQITWHVGPDMQYLQGRMGIYVCSWVASGGLEGGFFLGHRVPKQLAWVLQPTNPHFGVSDAILPDYLTGLFGYGQLSFGVNWYVLGGGVDLYAGMGAFSETPPGLSGAWSDIVGLPYVIGSCGVYVHGEILGGLVSASAWANLSLRGPIPTYFEGNFGLEGCVVWVLCASVEVTGGVNSSGFYLYS